MELKSTVQLLAVLGVLSLCHVSAFYPFFRPSNVNTGHVPRCPVSSKPCRVQAVLEGAPGTSGPETISSHPCSCPASKPCSDDWAGNADRVIVRELITEGNVNMTLSMMFCDTVHPQRICNPAEVALQLTGWTMVPTEVDYMSCTCADGLPMVLEQESYGADHRQYHQFVCNSDKRRCSMRRRSKDVCLESNPENHTITYPCKCPYGSACNPNPYNTPNLEYTCQRTGRNRRDQRRRQN